MDTVTAQRRQFVARALIGLFAVVQGLGARAQAEVKPASESLQRAETQIKAAFLFKFLAYVEWPPEAFADAAAPIRIGVLGSDLMLRELQAVVLGRERDGRAIQVRALDPADSPKGFQVLFVARSATGRLGAMLARAPGLPLLTVTEMTDSADEGGAINFVVEGDKVRFDVLPAHADRARLKLSARLLGVARRVVGDGG